MGVSDTSGGGSVRAQIPEGAISGPGRITFNNQIVQTCPREWSREQPDLTFESARGGMEVLRTGVPTYEG